MDTVQLGRTGVEVSVAGLGCGGHSRLGQRYGASEADSVTLVRRAIDLGVTFIDTARAYATEEIVGHAVAGAGCRDDVTISTKASAEDRDGPLSAAALRDSLEKSLKRLGLDCVDVFHLHGVPDRLYDHARDELVPAMLAMRDEGKLRFLAISEGFGGDPGHVMLQRAVQDDCWDVMMVGFNLLNPSARARVFEATIEKNIAVLVMFAVRRALSDPEQLRAVVADLVTRGVFAADDVHPDDPLGFLVHADGGAQSVVEAAYRFTRHEPGTTVVLSGTGKIEHLEANVAAINAPPLPQPDLDRLVALFGTIDFLSGN